jgi:hypothetical protein
VRFERQQIAARLTGPISGVQRSLSQRFLDGVAPRDPIGNDDEPVGRAHDLTIVVFAHDACELAGGVRKQERCASAARARDAPIDRTGHAVEAREAIEHEPRSRSRATPIARTEVGDH